MCCLIRQKCVRRVEKKAVQEKPVTLTVQFAAGRLSHPETLVWSHFYEHARAPVLTRPTVLGLHFPVPFCLLVRDILLSFGLFVRLCEVCPCISVVIHNFIVGAASHATKKCCSEECNEWKLKASHTLHTISILYRLRWLLQAFANLHYLFTLTNKLECRCALLNARVVFLEVSLPAKYFRWLLNKTFTLINTSLLWPMTSSTKPELVSEGL